MVVAQPQTRRGGRGEQDGENDGHRPHGGSVLSLPTASRKMSARTGRPGSPTPRRTSRAAPRGRAPARSGAGPASAPRASHASPGPSSAPPTAASAGTRGGSPP